MVPGLGRARRGPLRRATVARGGSAARVRCGLEPDLRLGAVLGRFHDGPVSRRALRDAGRGRGDRGRAVLLRGVLRKPSVLGGRLDYLHAPLRARPDGKGLFAKAEEFAQSGRIDPVEDLADDRVYLFSGEADDTVTTPVVDQTLAFYQAAGVPAANIKYVKTVDAGHAIVTNNSGDSSCAVTQPPFINDCDFVQSQELLRHIYGTLKPPASHLSGGIVTFEPARVHRLRPLQYERFGVRVRAEVLRKG